MASGHDSIGIGDPTVGVMVSGKHTIAALGSGVGDGLGVGGGGVTVGVGAAQAPASSATTSSTAGGTGEHRCRGMAGSEREYDQPDVNPT